MNRPGSEANKVLSKWQRFILNSSDLEAATRHVLLTLSIYLDADGTGAFPSMRTLAKNMKRSKNTVNQHILLAESKGYLKIHKDMGHAKGWKKNNYSVRFPKVYQ